jgi:hypothetical protein
MVPQKYHDPEQDLRREAVRAGRKGIGRRLQAALEEVVRQPVPRSWLTLLEQADRREHDDGPRRRTG